MFEWDHEIGSCGQREGIMEKVIKEEKKKPFLYRILYRIVRAVSPDYELEGEENVSGDPVIIVGNHTQMYGPVAGEMFMPRDNYIWCVHEMMDRKEAPEYSFNDFWSGKPGYIRWFYRILSKAIGSLCELIFKNSHTIAVYRDKRIITTVRDTLHRLREGYDVVIFPENSEKHNNILNGFHENFVDIARFWYRESGKELRFVPMYICPDLDRIRFGEPVQYDHEAVLDDERKRITGLLQDSITRMALSMPRHTVVPFLNVSKKDYPKNTPLEVYDEKTGI